MKYLFTLTIIVGIVGSWFLYNQNNKKKIRFIEDELNEFESDIIDFEYEEK